MLQDGQVSSQRWRCTGRDRRKQLCSQQPKDNFWPVSFSKAPVESTPLVTDRYWQCPKICWWKGTTTTTKYDSSLCPSLQLGSVVRGAVSHRVKTTKNKTGWKNFSLFLAFSGTYIQVNPFISIETMIWGTAKSQGLCGCFCLLLLWDHIKACLGPTTAALGSALLVSEHLGLTYIVPGFVSRMTKMHLHNSSQWRLPAAAVKWRRIHQASHRVPRIPPCVNYIYTNRLMGSSQSPWGTGSFSGYPHSLAEQTDREGTKLARCVEAPRIKAM